MADTKISAMTAADYALGADIIPIISGGANKRATVDKINAGSLIYLNADYTLTSTTSAQQIFDTTANGRLTLSETGLYEFDAMFWLTSMSATSGNAAFNLLGAGTATLAGQLMHSVGIDATTLTVGSTQTGAWGLGGNSLASNVVGATTGPAMAAAVKGVFKVTATGTLIPSVSLVTAAAAMVKAGSYFRCRRLAADGVHSVGNWD